MRTSQCSRIDGPIVLRNACVVELYPSSCFRKRCACLNDSVSGRQARNRAMRTAGPDANQNNALHPYVVFWNAKLKIVANRYPNAYPAKNKPDNIPLASNGASSIDVADALPTIPPMKMPNRHRTAMNLLYVCTNPVAISTTE